MCILLYLFSICYINFARIILNWVLLTVKIDYYWLLEKVEKVIEIEVITFFVTKILRWGNDTLI